MDESVEKSKRRGKISYRIPRGKEAEFDMLVALSGLSANGFLTHCIFRRNGHDPAKQVRLAQILNETARIKSALAEGDQLSEDAVKELRLIRTALMSLMGRRS